MQRSSAHGSPSHEQRDVAFRCTATLSPRRRSPAARRHTRGTASLSPMPQTRPAPKPHSPPVAPSSLPPRSPAVRRDTTGQVRNALEWRQGGGWTRGDVAAKALEAELLDRAAAQERLERINERLKAKLEEYQRQNMDNVERAECEIRRLREQLMQTAQELEREQEVRRVLELRLDAHQTTMHGIAIEGVEDAAKLRSQLLSLQSHLKRGAIHELQAADFRQHQLCRRVLRWWRGQVDRWQHIRLHYRAMKHNKLRRGFTRWRSSLTQSLQRKSTRSLAVFHDFSKRSGVIFDAWRSVTDEAYRIQRTNMGLLHHSAVLTAKSFAAWRAYVYQLRRAKRLLNSQSSKHAYTHTLAVALRKWRSYLKHRASIDKYYRERSLRFWQKKALRRAIRELMTWAATRRWLRHGGQRASALFLRKHFEAIKQFRLLSYQDKARDRRVESLYVQRAQRRLLTRWRESRQQALRLSVLQSRSKHSLANSAMATHFEAWKDYIAHTRTQKQLARSFRNNDLARAVHKWRDFAGAMKAMREREGRVGRFRKLAGRRGSGDALRVWRGSVDAAKERKRRLEEYRRKWDRCVLRGAFFRWGKYFAYAAHDRIKQMRLQVCEVQSSLDDERQRSSIVSERNKELSEQLDLVHGRLIAGKDELRDMESKMSALEHAQAAVRAAREESERLRAAHIDAERRLEETRQRMAENQEAAVSERRALERQLGSVQQQLQAKDHSLSAAQEGLHQLQGELSTSQQDTQQKLQQALDVTASLRRLLEDKTGEINELQREKQAWTFKQQQLEGMLEHEQRTSASAVDSRDRRIAQLEQELHDMTNSSNQAEENYQRSQAESASRALEIRKLKYQLELLETRHDLPPPPTIPPHPIPTPTPRDTQQQSPHTHTHPVVPRSPHPSGPSGERYAEERMADDDLKHELSALQQRLLTKLKRADRERMGGVCVSPPVCATERLMAGGGEGEGGGAFLVSSPLLPSCPPSFASSPRHRTTLQPLGGRGRAMPRSVSPPFSTSEAPISAASAKSVTPPPPQRRKAPFLPPLPSLPLARDRPTPAASAAAADSLPGKRTWTDPGREVVRAPKAPASQPPRSSTFPKAMPPRSKTLSPGRGGDEWEGSEGACIPTSPLQHVPQGDAAAEQDAVAWPWG
ncbi:unnamed protein product [Vitrella brassicaformis CCMP3155]|uniref:Sfi1 spindle body domain-containing protein n=2 Tax=Vitrella brassicaformis TaxID=1169539 RepID=A0A0G4EGQ3_VITBC|nr:unnamed protein product [Vitrella brassicaformis CCMP3155]|eukprot:CEL95634.1 unnamed protein product [Vitrella brassicaformis CCMP3155]